MGYNKFKRLCQKTQREMKSYLAQVLRSAGYDVVVGDGYVYGREANTPVLLTAHMDTVHKAMPDIIVEKKENGKHILFSPNGIGGDDRCGIWIILQIINKTDLRPAILFCEDEEIGGVGSEKFSQSALVKELEKLKFLVELDRRGNYDAVFYDCDNFEFTRFIEKTTGFREAWGTFSDIGNIAPVAKVAAVNLSCGYYCEHKPDEYVVMEEMENTLKVTKKLLDVAKKDETPKYEYIEAVYNYTPYSKGYYSDTSWGWTYRTAKIPKGKTWILWAEDNSECETYYDTASLEEGMGCFFMDHPKVRFLDIIDYDYWEE